MTAVSTSSVLSCRWDWCRSSFPNIDALDTHVKHEHIWPMKPMRKADIALMRRMDLQSLHSSPNTDSSTVSRGLIARVLRDKVPPLPASPTSTPQTHEHPESQTFDTFAHPRAHSPQRLPASPALDALVMQDKHLGLSAAAEMFERARGSKANQHLRLPSHQRSPIHRPLSESSGSSQEVVEQLTQQDDVEIQPERLLASELQNENDLLDVELRWPTDDESDVLAIGGTQSPEQPVSSHPGSSPESARDRNFRSGSLNVHLGGSSQNADPLQTSWGSHSQSQPIVLQTQAPYSSQTTLTQ